MSEIKVYTKNFCGYCSAAKQLIASKGYQFEEINMESDPELMMEIVKKSGQRTVPQIFVGEQSIGGFQELLASTSSGEFAELVAAQIK